MSVRPATFYVYLRLKKIEKRSLAEMLIYFTVKNWRRLWYKMGIKPNEKDSEFMAERYSKIYTSRPR